VAQEPAGPRGCRFPQGDIKTPIRRTRSGCCARAVSPRLNHGQQKGRSSVSPGASPSTTADCEGLLVGGVRPLPNWLSPSQMTTISHPTAIPLAAFGLVCLSIKFPSQFFEGVFGVELARSVGEFQTLFRTHPKFLDSGHGFAPSNHCQRAKALDRSQFSLRKNYAAKRCSKASALFLNSAANCSSAILTYHSLASSESFKHISACCWYSCDVGMGFPDPYVGARTSLLKQNRSLAQGANAEPAEIEASKRVRLKFEGGPSVSSER
jgi:hypothetical protein